MRAAIALRARYARCLGRTDERAWPPGLHARIWFAKRTDAGM